MRGGINELGHVLFDDLIASSGGLWMFDLIWNLKYFYYYFPIFTRCVSIKAYLFHPKVVGVHKSALCPSAERGGVNYWVTEIWIIIIRWPLKLSINRGNDFIKINLLIIVYPKRRYSFDKLLSNQWVGVKPQTKVINQSINYYHCDVIADEINWFQLKALTVSTPGNLGTFLRKLICSWYASMWILHATTSNLPTDSGSFNNDVANKIRKSLAIIMKRRATQQKSHYGGPNKTRFLWRSNGSPDFIY